MGFFKNTGTSIPEYKLKEFDGGVFGHKSFPDCPAGTLLRIDTECSAGCATLEVVPILPGREKDICRNCFFHTASLFDESFRCNFSSCGAKNRRDGKEVYFKRISWDSSVTQAQVSQDQRQTK